MATKYNGIEIVSEGTPEKHLPMMDVLITPLIELLKQLSELENEVFEKSTQLKEESIKAGNPTWREPAGRKELFAEYKEKYGQFVIPRCTEKLLKRGYASGCSKPASYDYVNTGCKIVFSMKTANRAVIETHYPHGVDAKHQFILRNIDGEWKIDSVKYGYGDEAIWHDYHI